MSTHRSNRTRYRPARRTPDSVADLSRLPPIGQAHKRWVLRRIINLNNDRHALREKAVSYKTMEERYGELQRFFEALWSQQLYRKVDPRSLRPKHIAVVLARWRSVGLSPNTLRNRISVLRTFSFWIGKRGLVETAVRQGLLDLSGLAVSQVAKEDKSWWPRGIDVQAIIEAAAKHCVYVAASSALMDAFGLRVKESVMTHPHEDVVPIEPDEFDDAWPPGVTHALDVRGAKGDRPRRIPIETEKQWAALRRAQALVAPGQPMGRPGRTLKANLEHVYRVLGKIGITRKKLGVTAHGLRHQRCNDEFEIVTGEPSPVRGGRPIDAELERAARDKIATMAGHVRRQIVASYLGKPVVMRSSSMRARSGSDGGASST